MTAAHRLASLLLAIFSAAFVPIAASSASSPPDSSPPLATDPQASHTGGGLSSESPLGQTPKDAVENLKVVNLQGTKLQGKWAPCSFGGDGAVEIDHAGIKSQAFAGHADADGSSDETSGDPAEISLGFGDPLTGVYWTGEVPRENYRWSFEAKRTEGFDFFAATTFAVGDGHATFVPGGWGGGITGLSNIDGNDASNNETSKFVPIDSDRWYRFEVIVDKETVRCSIDGKVVVDVVRGDKMFSLRAEMDQCEPLGIAAFQSGSLIRNMSIQSLADTQSSDD